MTAVWRAWDRDDEASMPRTLTCVGHVQRPAGPVLYEMEFSWIERATDEAERVLSSWGVGRNDHVLMICATSEFLQAYPWQRALARLGAAFSCADNGSYDAARVAMFLRDFQLRLVIGLDRAMVDALHEFSDDAPALLGRPDALMVRSDALGGHPNAKAWWQPVGPGVIAECSAKRGGHVIPSTLNVATVGHQVMIRDAIHRWPMPASVAGTSTCSCGITATRVTRPDEQERRQ